MSESHNSIIKIASNLMAACFISGLVIGAVYFVTAPVAAQKAVERKENALRELVPEADHFAEIDGQDGWYRAEKGGQAIGYIVPSHTKGYGGDIKLLVAVTPDAHVIDYKILAHNETPGLGDNASKEPFRSKLRGKAADHLIVTKDKNNTEDVQAMTGATISSRAVTRGVKEAVTAVADELAKGGAK